MADVTDETLSEGDLPQEPQIIESDKFEYTKADFKIYKLTRESDFNHLEPETQILHIHKGNKYLEGLNYEDLPNEKINTLAPRILYSIQRGDFGPLNYMVDHAYTNYRDEPILSPNTEDEDEKELEDNDNGSQSQEQEEVDGDGDGEEKRSDNEEEENVDEIGEGLSKDEKYEIRSGNTKVKDLLNTISDAQGKNMLHYAIEYDQYKLFLKIMHLAIENDMFEKLLFKQDKRNGWTCFINAVVYRRIDIIQWIIDKFLIYPTSPKKFALLQDLILCETFAKRHSLHWAITKQYDDIILLLLKTLHKIGCNILVENEEEDSSEMNSQAVKRFFKVYYEDFDYNAINYKEEEEKTEDSERESEESKEDGGESIENNEESKEESKE